MLKYNVMKTFEDIQKEEAATWLIEDETQRKEKAQREAIRYPLLRKQMGLDNLDTSDMVVYDIGAGPLGGVSSVIASRRVVRFDPLTPEYRKYFPCYNYESIKAEEIGEELGQADLVISTNCIDHFEAPSLYLTQLVNFMKKGAYFAHLHAIDNAYSHPHEAHVHNINPEMMREYLDEAFELVWNLDYRHDGLTYGWRKQPAFAQLWRKI